MTNRQIQMVQIAVRTAGFRTKHSNGRYLMLLGNYQQPNGQKVTSCKQLNNWQVEDLLAICELWGWRCPGKDEDHFRKKVAASKIDGDVASYAAQAAIKHLAGDLGWNEAQLEGMIKRITKEEVSNIAGLSKSQGYKVIEALKAMVSRSTGKKYNNLKEIKKDMEVSTDGEEKNQAG